MARKGSGTFTSAEKKSEKSSSGLGLSIGLGTVGDIEIKGVVDVDISPLSGDINYDASENDLSVNGEIGLPGNTVSIGGGVTVDLDTGSISGGSASLGFGGGEVEVSISECEQTLQVTYWGAGFAVSKNNCDDSDENDGGGDEDEGDGWGWIGQPNPPQPSFDLPSGYTGFACPIYEITNHHKEIPSRDISIPNMSETTITAQKIGLAPSGETVFDQTAVWRQFKGVQMLTGDWGYYRISNSVAGLSQVLIWGGYAGGYNSEDDNRLPYEEKNGGTYIINWFARFLYPELYPSMEPCFYVKNYYNPPTNNRRSIPPEDMSNNQCCDASISLLRKIAKVLAVDELLAPFQTSGKILKEAEKGIDKILEDPDQVIEINNYIALNTILSLLSNRKVALAVGADELEFEKDEKKPEFHYLRWLKEYSEGLTSLSYQEWIESKNKKEGLKASKTQFKSIPQLMLAELYNSKTTNDVLRARDLMKRGMEIPNELLVPGGLGFSVVYDYPNIFKKLIQMIDLSTIQPFTAILQDADPAKEGNQPLTRYYPDATSAVKEIIELLLENKVDSATRLNILMRQSILNTQQQIALLETLSIAYTIMYGLGLPFHQKGSHFIAPFDVSPKTDNTTDTKGKGFNPKNKKEEEATQSAINSLNENNENSTEKMLPDFLKTVKQEYLHTYFDDSKESLWYYVMSVFMKI